MTLDADVKKGLLLLIVVTVISKASVVASITLHQMALVNVSAGIIAGDFNYIMVKPLHGCHH